MPSAVNDSQERAYEHLAQRGYVIALSNLDGEDWRRAGVDSIVRGITPRGTEGGIVLLHDGGGDRSQTVAALERAVPALQARGFRFVTVSELGGIPSDQTELKADGWAHRRGQMLLGTLAVARWTTYALGLLLVVVTALFGARVFILIAFARRHVRSVRRAPASEPLAPPVSVVVPAFNEAVGIERAVASLAASEYPDFEVIVVDDGSTDGTASLVEELGLPMVSVLRQPNAGKPSALNAGVAAARHDVIVMVDADTVFEAETLMAPRPATSRP